MWTGTNVADFVELEVMFHYYGHDKPLRITGPKVALDIPLGDWLVVGLTAGPRGYSPEDFEKHFFEDKV